MMPEDLPGALAPAVLDEAASENEEVLQLVSAEATALGVCLSYTGFYTVFATILAALVVSSLSAAFMYLKLQRIRYDKNRDMPRCS